jgi:hypothetical protein
MKNGSRTVGIAATGPLAAPHGGHSSSNSGSLGKDSKNVAYIYQTVAQLHFRVCIGLSSCQLFFRTLK